MTHDCETCGRPAPNATICPICSHKLDAAIADVCAYQGLAYDLDVAMSRQSRLGARDGSRPTEAAVAYDQRASEAASHLKAVLVSWARIVHEETGAGLPPDTLAGVAAWLRPRVGWLRHHPAGAEAHNEITDAVKAARRVCDRPADRLYAGPCDECGEGLYAIAGALIVECRPCDLVYDVDARRGWLLAALEDHLVNATQMSRLLTYLGIKLAPTSVRMYASKGRITAHGQDAKRCPLYRLGDVVATYYGASQKVS